MSVDPRVRLQSTQINTNESDSQVEICAVLENVMGMTSFPIEVTFSLMNGLAGELLIGSCSHYTVIHAYFSYGNTCLLIIILNTGK